MCIYIVNMPKYMYPLASLKHSYGKLPSYKGNPARISSSGVDPGPRQDLRAIPIGPAGCEPFFVDQ